MEKKSSILIYYLKNIPSSIVNRCFRHKFMHIRRVIRSLKIGKNVLESHRKSHEIFIQVCEPCLIHLQTPNNQGFIISFRCTEGTWSKRDVMATLWAQVIWPSGQGCYLNTTCSQLIVMVNKAVALPASHTFKVYREFLHFYPPSRCNLLCSKPQWHQINLIQY